MKYFFFKNMFSKRTLINLLRYFIFMAVVIGIISAALFTYIPAEEVKKTIIYAARDLTTPSTDIITIYPMSSNITTFSVSNKNQVYSSEYIWTYDKQTYSYKIEIPQELYEYYSNRNHDRYDYEQYAVSDYDREIIQKLAKSFADHGRRNKHSEEQIAANVIAFTHSIPYLTDIETTGFDEYPRYPVETLIDGGDCEDLAILAVAILYELNQECILVRLENHMGIGLKDSGNYTGISYLYNETVYYYAGVTEGETAVGIIPKSIDPTLKELYYVQPMPKVSGHLVQHVSGFDEKSYRYSLRGNIENEGSGIGKNVTVRIETKLNNRSSEPIPDTLIPIGNIPEDYNADIEVSFSVPRSSGIVDIWIEGDNFDSFEVTGFHFSFGK
jgi:Predicted periplasmic protein